MGKIKKQKQRASKPGVRDQEDLSMDVPSLIEEHLTMLGKNSGNVCRMPIPLRENIKSKNSLILRSSRLLLKSCIIRKKTKHKLRSKVFMSEIKEREKGFKNPVKSLKLKTKGSDIQPSVKAPLVKNSSSLVKNNGKVRKKSIKGISKSQDRHQSMLQDVALFQNILSNPAYHADPTGSISKILQSSVIANN